MIIDPSIGEEICAVYMEDPAYVDQLSKVRPFNLTVPASPVHLMVWRIHRMADCCALSPGGHGRTVSKSSAMTQRIAGIPARDDSLGEGQAPLAS
jgi:hypothetical protein